MPGPSIMRGNAVARQINAGKLTVKEVDACARQVSFWGSQMLCLMLIAGWALPHRRFSSLSTSQSSLVFHLMRRNV